MRHTIMYSHLARLVTRNWPWTIAAWLIAVGVVRFVAPAWDDVTLDGDLAFLPAKPSERFVASVWEREAFPETRGKSQMVLVVARKTSRWSHPTCNLSTSSRVAFHNRLGATEWKRGEQYSAKATGGGTCWKCGRSGQPARIGSRGMDQSLGGAGRGPKA
jgi:hypothetical protein